MCYELNTMRGCKKWSSPFVVRVVNEIVKFSLGRIYVRASADVRIVTFDVCDVMFCVLDEC